MSHPVEAEWSAVLSCDGVSITCLVKKRVSRLGVRRVRDEAFELWSDNKLIAVFVFPILRRRETAEHALRYDLAKVLNCSEVVVETDGDQVETLFHIAAGIDNDG